MSATDAATDTATSSEGSNKIKNFFTSNALKFVENEWFFLSVSGVAVILWVVSASVALSAGTVVSELTSSDSSSDSSSNSSSDSADEDLAVKQASNEQTVAGVMLGIGIVFLIFWLFCAITFLMRKMK